jgi:hypothetical protein
VCVESIYFLHHYDLLYRIYWSIKLKVGVHAEASPLCGTGVLSIAYPASLA